MSPTKKILLAVAGAFGLVLAALLVLPFLFVDQIEARVRAEIEDAARVRVSWTDVGLSLIRDFPRPSFGLTGLAVVGTEPFEGDTLATIADLRLSLDGPSVIRAVRGRGPLIVHSVRVIEPRLSLRVNEDGAASWDVLPDGEAAADQRAERDIALSLRSFELTDGDIVLDDASSGLFLSVEGLRHELRGDFSRTSLVARTSTHSDAVTLRFAGAPYLAGVALDLDADLDVDRAERRARLIDNELRLNDLVVRFEGDVARRGDDLVMDLGFAAPSTAFEQILSLIPAMYAQDFASLETSGTFSLDGSVQGAYGERSFPSFAIDLDVVDGRFRYPDAPLPAEEIAAELMITNPGGDRDSTVVDLSRFHARIGENAFDAAVTLRTPLSDPEADVRVQGTVDLGDVARTMKLEDTGEVNGLITADATVRARRSDVDSARYDRIAARGTIQARDVTLRGEALRQPVDIQEASIELSPQTAELRAFEARLGSSDLQATGRLDNLLGFVLGSQPLTGSARFASSRVLLDEWRSDDGATAIAVPARLDLTLDGTIEELLYDGLEMRNARGRLIVRDQRMTFEGFTLETLGGRVGMEGYYETLEPTRPTFALDLAVDSVDVAAASEQVVTMRALAPVARYTRGTFSSNLALSGALGEDMAPVLEVLDGDGSVATSQLAIEGFPLLDRLAERLSLQRLSNPTVDAVRSNIHIQGGRLVVEPFDVGLAGLGMTVSGSNGIDQSLDYTLGLRVPRTSLADAALTTLASRAGPLGASLAAADPVRVAVRVTGTIMQPSLDLSLSETVGSVGEAATRSAEAAVEQRIDEAQQRIDAQREEARARARAQADSIVAEAERRAEAIRAEAGRAAAEVRAQGDRAADEVLARATNPLARAAAQPAADRIRREAEERAVAIEQEADERATALVAEARARADALVGGGGSPHL